MALLEAVLSNGRSSRLYRSLVYEKQLASQVNMWNFLTADGGMSAPVVTLAKGRSIDEAQAALAAEIMRLRDEPIGAEELRKAKNVCSSAAA